MDVEAQWQQFINGDDGDIFTLPEKPKITNKTEIIFKDFIFSMNIINNINL